ncbi:MAG: hypothetical protein ACKOCK_04495 [Chloroflexota bacterium]
MKRIALLTLPILLLILSAIGSASADPDRGSHAGLVIRRADGALTYAWVAFPEPEITAIELLKRSGVPLLTADFGGLGEAVCQLEGEGCSFAVCRRNVCQVGAEAPYWRYFRQGEDGQWTPRILGASTSKVRDGDVDGWSWTAGEANLPLMSASEVAVKAGAGDDPGGVAVWREQPVPTRSAEVTRSTILGIGVIAVVAALAGFGIARIRNRRVAS